ncbi:hypothetical protein SSPS47_18900 [Streptomyces sp. S4.7]|nr:hypothetical protein SSPS47_18900 [Streptomyces sp. S4.7]
MNSRAHRISSAWGWRPGGGVRPPGRYGRTGPRPRRPQDRPGRAVLAVQQDRGGQVPVPEFGEERGGRRRGGVRVGVRDLGEHPQYAAGRGPGEEAADRVRTGVEARLDADAPGEQGVRDQIRAVLVPVHRGVVRQHGPGADQRGPPLGVGGRPGARRDAHRDTGCGCPYGGQRRRDVRRGQGVRAVVVLRMQMYVLGPVRDGVPHGDAEFGRRDGQPGVLGTGPRAVRADLKDAVSRHVAKPAPAHRGDHVAPGDGRAAVQKDV